MKHLKIEIPSGYEIDKVNSTFENIVLKLIKKELPKSWDELKRVKGYYINHVSCIHIHDREEEDTVNSYNKNLFATKEQAEASLALAQLSQLREVYRDGWKPDWTNIIQDKFCLYFYHNKIKEATYSITQAFLSFQSEEVRDLFLENFRDLIEQAKPLMS